MMPLPFAAIGYGSLVGLSLGLTGSGGSILAIPLLVYGLGMPVSHAIVVSLLMVATIALFGAVRQSFERNVNWRAAILFSLAGMIVSPVVIQLAYNVDDTLRLTLFAVLMLLVAFRMAFSHKKNSSSHSAGGKTRQYSLTNGSKIIAGGATAGALAGFFGVGGGIGMLAGSTLVNAIPDSLAKVIFAAAITALALFMLIDKLYIQQGGL